MKQADLAEEAVAFVRRERGILQHRAQRWILADPFTGLPLSYRANCGEFRTDCRCPIANRAVFPTLRTAVRKTTSPLAQLYRSQAAPQVANQMWH